METYEIKDGQKIFSWCVGADKEVADNEQHKTAYDQMEIISKLSYVRHCALMADAHSGYDMPIGGCVLCDGVVVPNFVGVDIGCGCGVIRTSLNKSEIEDEVLRRSVLHSLSRSIPVSFNHNSQKRTNELENRFEKEIDHIVGETVDSVSSDHNPVGNFRKEFASQLGTLGGG